VAAKAGTVGFGADLHRAIVPRVLNLRVGASFFRYSTDLTDNGIDYAARLELGAVPILADVYPFKNWFRLEGGFVVNLNKVQGTARPKMGLIDIGGHSYSSDQLGQLDASTRLNRVAPYFGLGFSNPIKKRGHWGVLFDIGVMYHGRPGLNLSTTKTPIPDLQFDLQNQVQRFENDARRFTFYPIIQFGISYNFGKKGL